MLFCLLWIESYLSYCSLSLCLLEFGYSPLTSTREVLPTELAWRNGYNIIYIFFAPFCVNARRTQRNTATSPPGTTINITEITFDLFLAVWIIAGMSRHTVVTIKVASDCRSLTEHMNRLQFITTITNVFTNKIVLLESAWIFVFWRVITEN